jgi:hypothetical protein
MKTKFHEHRKETNMNVSKKLFVLATILTGTLIATSAYSQVSIHVGFNIPARRVYVAPPPPPTVVYQQYPAPAPVCQDQDEYYEQAPATVVYESEFPGYMYYNYPVWNGHYRDRVYYEHYRPYFYRDCRPYFNGGRFDHARFEHDRGWHRGWDRHGRDRW